MWIATVRTINGDIQTTVDKGYRLVAIGAAKLQAAQRLGVGFDDTEVIEIMEVKDAEAN